MRARYYSTSTGKQDLLNLLSEAEVAEQVYNSNAIEGSTMTFNETKLVLNEGLTIGGKKLNEHLEIINHKYAIDFIEELSKNNVITLRDIKDIHCLIVEI